MSIQDLADVVEEHRKLLKPIGYFSVIPDRRPVVKGHRSLGLARAAVSYRDSWRNGIPSNATIWGYGPEGPELIHFIPKGTRSGEMPWKVQDWGLDK